MTRVDEQRARGANRRIIFGLAFLLLAVLLSPFSRRTATYEAIINPLAWLAHARFSIDWLENGEGEEGGFTIGAAWGGEGDPSGGMRIEYRDGEIFLAVRAETPGGPEAEALAATGTEGDDTGDWVRVPLVQKEKKDLSPLLPGNRWLEVAQVVQTLFDLPEPQAAEGDLATPNVAPAPDEAAVEPASFQAPNQPEPEKEEPPLR